MPVRQLRDDGNATVQTALIVPVLVTLLLFVVMCGRLVETRLRVDAVSQDAAREASLARTPQTAEAAARRAAAEQLGRGGTTCASYTVSVDTARFRPGGSVTVSVKCQAAVGDLTGLSLPGHVGIGSTSISAVDPYRGAS